MRTRTIETSGVGPSKPMPAVVKQTPRAPNTGGRDPRSAFELPPEAFAQRNPFEDTTPRVPTHTAPGPATGDAGPAFATHDAGSRIATHELAPPVPAMLPVAGEPEVHTSSTRSAEWTRMVFPSKMLPYTFDVVWVRPLTIGVLSVLDSARRNNSFTMLVDALNHCIDVDIRDLTPADFYYLMYWVRDNSYPKRALTLSWRSQYGNDNTTRVRLQKGPTDDPSWREMKVVELDMTAEEVAAYREQGLCFPTVRDMELLKSGTVEDVDLWRVEYAQYVVPTPPDNPARPHDRYLERKLAALEALGLGGVGAIDSFTNRLTHGVQEFLHVVDEHFDVLEVIDRKRATLDQLVTIVNNILGDDPENLYTATLTGLLQRIETEKTQLDTMLAAVNAGETVLPEQEVITLDIVVMDFFPEVQ